MSLVQPDKWSLIRNPCLIDWPTRCLSLDFDVCWLVYCRLLKRGSNSHPCFPTRRVDDHNALLKCRMKQSKIFWINTGKAHDIFKRMSCKMDLAPALQSNAQKTNWPDFKWQLSVSTHAKTWTSDQRFFWRCSLSTEKNVMHRLK